jgi:hypothetical protein
MIASKNQNPNTKWYDAEVTFSGRIDRVVTHDVEATNPVTALTTLLEATLDDLRDEFPEMMMYEVEAAVTEVSIKSM